MKSTYTVVNNGRINRIENGRYRRYRAGDSVELDEREARQFAPIIDGPVPSAADLRARENIQAWEDVSRPVAARVPKAREAVRDEPATDPQDPAPSGDLGEASHASRAEFTPPDPAVHFRRGRSRRRDG